MVSAVWPVASTRVVIDGIPGCAEQVMDGCVTYGVSVPPVPPGSQKQNWLLSTLKVRRIWWRPRRRWRRWRRRAAAAAAAAHTQAHGGARTRARAHALTRMRMLSRVRAEERARADWRLRNRCGDPRWSRPDRRASVRVPHCARVSERVGGWVGVRATACVRALRAYSAPRCESTHLACVLCARDARCWLHGSGCSKACRATQLTEYLKNIFKEHHDKLAKARWSPGCPRACALRLRTFRVLECLYPCRLFSLCLCVHVHVRVRVDVCRRVSAYASTPVDACACKRVCMCARARAIRVCAGVCAHACVRMRVCACARAAYTIHPPCRALHRYETMCANGSRKWTAARPSRRRPTSCGSLQGAESRRCAGVYLGCCGNRRSACSKQDLGATVERVQAAQPGRARNATQF
jgi:hypothetical protein